jgi:hypothetical protein
MWIFPTIIVVYTNTYIYIYILFFFFCLDKIILLNENKLTFMQTRNLHKQKTTLINPTISTSLYGQDLQLIRIIIIHVVLFRSIQIICWYSKIVCFILIASSAKSPRALAMDDFVHKFGRLKSIVYHSFNFFSCRQW